MLWMFFYIYKVIGTDVFNIRRKESNSPWARGRALVRDRLE